MDNKLREAGEKLREISNGLYIITILIDLGEVVISSKGKLRWLYKVKHLGEDRYRFVFYKNKYPIDFELSEESLLTEILKRILWKIN